MPRPSRRPCATCVFVTRNAGSKPSRRPTAKVKATTKPRVRRSAAGGSTIVGSATSHSRPGSEQGCDADAGHAAGDRQTQTLGDQLSYQPAPAGAKRETRRDLARSRDGSREQKVAQIGAGDQQDKSRGPQHHGERLCKRGADGRCACRRRGGFKMLLERARARLGIGNRVVVRDQALLEDEVRARLRAFRRDAWRQAAEDVQPHDLLDASRLIAKPVAARQHGRLHRERNPCVGLIPDRLTKERCRRHADNRDETAAERHRAADRVRSSAETALPVG